MQCQEKCYGADNAALLRVSPEAERVLDCGCGTGKNGQYFLARGASLFGITISQQEALAANIHFPVVVADMERGLPLHGRFDLIVMSHVIEHLRDPRNALRDARALLEDRGFLLVALPNSAQIWHRFEFMCGEIQYRDHGIMDHTHVHLYTLKSGRALLEDNGFCISAYS